MKKIWDVWELKAINFLKEKGYVIVDTNFKFWKIWEVDIIARHKNLFIFIEVKTRKNCLYWYPEESLTHNKKMKILKTIQYYCLLRKISLEYVRFDFISIFEDSIVHYENIELY